MSAPRALDLLPGRLTRAGRCVGAFPPLPTLFAAGWRCACIQQSKAKTVALKATSQDTERLVDRCWPGRLAFWHFVGRPVRRAARPSAARRAVATSRPRGALSSRFQKSLIGILIGITVPREPARKSRGRWGGGNNILVQYSVRQNLAEHQPHVAARQRCGRIAEHPHAGLPGAHATHMPKLIDGLTLVHCGQLAPGQPHARALCQRRAL